MPDAPDVFEEIEEARGAFCLAAAFEVVQRRAGDSPDVVPIRLIARSGAAAMSPKLGRVFHELEGCRVLKERIPINFSHNDSEIIGFVNEVERSADALVLSGGLVPFGDRDRASEIIHKMRVGVPYDASIEFAPDDATVCEKIPGGRVTLVNGREVKGPATVFRSWPLRAVAITQSGADANTASFLMSQAETVKLKVIPGGDEMPDPEGKKEGQALLEQLTKPEEAPAPNPPPAPDPAPPATNPAPEPPAPPPAPEPKKEGGEEGDRQRLKAYVDAYGRDQGLSYFMLALSPAAAAAEYAKHLRKENEELRAQVLQLSAKPGGPEVPPGAADGGPATAPARPGLTATQAKFADSLHIKGK